MLVNPGLRRFLGSGDFVSLSASFSSPNITITATTGVNLTAGRFGAAISVNGGAATWYDGAGAASSQSLTLSLTDIGAVAGDLIGIDPGYSLTDPATTKVYASASGLYITPSITTPTISDTTPTVGDTLTGTNGTALTRLSATRSVLWLADGSSTGDTDSSYSVVSGDIGKVLTYRNTTDDGGSATSAATSAVVAGAVLVSGDTPGKTNGTQSGTTATISSMTVSAGPASNGIMVLVVLMTSGGAARTVSGVTWNGSSAGWTQVPGAYKTVTAASTNNISIDIWYLKTPAAATADIVVTINAAARIIAGATTYINVNQTTPIGTAVNNSSAVSNSTITAGAATSTPSDIVVGGMWVEGSNIVDITSSDTSDFAVDQTSFNEGSGSGSHSNTANVNLTWTDAGGNAGWVAAAVPIKP